MAIRCGPAAVEGLLCMVCVNRIADVFKSISRLPDTMLCVGTAGST
jgi:hypothetical protein